MNIDEIELSDQDYNVSNLKLNINNFENKLVQVDKKIKFLIVFINNLLSDKGIVKKLNAYYCSDRVLKKELCYLYLNNIINPLNQIIIWKSRFPVYNHLLKKLSLIKKGTITNSKTIKKEEFLSSNYLSNTDNYKKIVGQEIIVDFSYNKVVDNPSKFLIKGIIKKFNNPNFYFWLINSFTIEFVKHKKDQTDQTDIIKDFSKNNSFVCWESEKSNQYNLLLSNGDNEGLKFHFVKSFTDLGINKNEIIKNKKSIKPDIKKDKLVYIEYLVNKILPMSKKIPHKFNYLTSKPIINLLFPNILTPNNIFCYHLKGLKFFVKLEPVNINNFNSSLIGNHNLHYSERDIGLNSKWFSKQNIPFSLEFNKFLFDEPWTWSLLIIPKLLGVSYKNDFYSLGDLEEMVGKNINLFDLSYLTWQLKNIENNLDDSGNSNEYVIKLLEYLEISCSRQLLNQLGKKNTTRNEIVKENLLESWSNVSDCNIKSLSQCNIRKRKKNNLSKLLNDAKSLVTFNHIITQNYLENIIKIADKNDNYDVKYVLYNTLTKLCIKDLDKIIVTIKTELNTWNNIQNAISGQLEIDEYKDKENLPEYKNLEFNKKYKEIINILNQINER